MATATKSSAAAGHRLKPEKPDEEAYKTSLANAEKELAALQQKMEEIKAKIDLAKPNNQDSPTAKRQHELRDQLASIRQQQQGFKVSRGRTQEKINAIDANIKSRLAEQKQARSRVPFKSVEEIDREIQRLEMQVDSGTMKLADEKRNLSEMSNLRKQRKTFAGFDETHKEIDELKSQLSDMKKALDNPEARSLSEKYTAIQKELDDIKADQDDIFKNLASLRDERTKIHAEQQKAYFAVRGIKDDYFKARKAYKEYEDEAFRLRRERQKAERESYERERRKKIADKKLEDASRPAYTDEILIAEGLIRHFDPTYDLSALCLDKDKKALSGSYRAEVGRTVDDSNIRGVKIKKKDDRDSNYFMAATGGKKGKKGKKGSNASTPTPGTPVEGGKFNLSFGVIEDLSKVKVDPPMNPSDVPGLVERLAMKIVNWKNDQQARTAENVKKAQDEIDRLGEEVTTSSTAPKTGGQRSGDVARKPAASSEDTNGHTSVTADDTLTDPSKELQKASLEDQE